MPYFIMRVRRHLRRYIGILLCLLLLVLAFYLFFARLQPLMGDLAVARVSNQASKLVSSAINEAIQSGEVDYGRLIDFEKDDTGKVTALKSNMAEFNRLQTLIDSIVLQHLSEVSVSTLSVPVGTLTGITLLSGRGPVINVRMQSVGSSTSRFENEFSSAGINQTKHRIVLNVDVRISILLPGTKTSTTVSNSYVVAETIIVGSVPETYTYFHSDQVQDIEDSIINDT